MIEDVFREFLFVEEFVYFVYVLPDLGQVERSKILEKSLVNKILHEFKNTLSMLKKKALGISLGGELSARK